MEFFSSSVPGGFFDFEEFLLFDMVHFHDRQHKTPLGNNPAAEFLKS